jgi:hypothetical protein
MLTQQIDMSSRSRQKTVKQHREEIEASFPPPCSPELSPDEHLNGDLKGRVHSDQPVRTGWNPEKKARQHMHGLQKQPAKIKSCFRHPQVRDAGH